MRPTSTRWISNLTRNWCCFTQTTLSVDETAGTITALKARFPWLEMPPNSDICYATSNRQAAVKLVAEQADCVVIVGSANSSNSVRLMEVAQEGT